MTEMPGTLVDDEPVSKRTRRAGVVTSVGDPFLKDRSKVAPLFLSKKEKQEKLYRKEQEKLTESTKARLNDWKSVIGVEKDASKVCPVFQRASVSSTLSNIPRAFISAPAVDLKPISALVGCGIVPDPYSSVIECVDLRAPRVRSEYVFDEKFADEMLRKTLDLRDEYLDLSTPHKEAPATDRNEYPEIDKPTQAACLSALRSMSRGKLFHESSCQVIDWLPTNSRDWCAARMEGKNKQHSLSRRLSKWRDEDTAVKRNRVAPILLVSGHTGSGKTSLVHACASELNMQVLEVSASDFSWQANGKRSISEAVREALQSRQVKNEANASQLVLIDDVDVLVKEDKSVLNSISSMTQDSKRPLVLTCIDESVMESLEIDECFRINKIDLSTASFLSFAYQQVLGRNSGSNRSESDLIAQHCGGDLRRIGMAAEMRCVRSEAENLSSIFPCDIYCVNYNADLFSNPARLVRTLIDQQGRPLSVQGGGQLDLVDYLGWTMSCDSTSLQDWETRMSVLSISGLSNLDPVVSSQLSLSAFKPAVSDPLSWTRGTVTVSEEEIKQLIDPFVSTRTAFHLTSQRKRFAPFLQHLGIMARLSSASEFSSRRVRCVLDQFPASVTEISRLRLVFP